MFLPECNKFNDIISNIDLFELSTDNTTINKFDTTKGIQENITENRKKFTFLFYLKCFSVIEK